jgi:cytochrome c-type biogenesis protein CcmE
MKRYRFILGALVIAAGMIYLMLTGFHQSAAKNLNLASLLERTARGDLSGERVQLGGNRVVAGSIQWDEYHSRPQFTITDGERTLRVRYTGHSTLPDTFKDQAMVVLEGRYDTGRSTFDADVVFAKCPSKYEGQSYEDHLQAGNGS